MQPVEQPVGPPVECLYIRYNRLCNRLFNRLDNRLFNRLDNRLYCVNGVSRNRENQRNREFTQQNRTEHVQTYDEL